jgi:hypothetical protein
MNANLTTISFSKLKVTLISSGPKGILFNIPKIE